MAFALRKNRQLYAALVLASAVISLITWVFVSGCLSPPSSPPVAKERIYLQQITQNSVIVKWRNGTTVLKSVNYGTDVNALNQSLSGVVSGNNMEAYISNLSPDTTYYYAFDSTTGTAQQSFRTAPVTGQLPADGSTRVWIIGDSGTADSNVKALRDGYYAFNDGVKQADVWLMLGDNAYSDGTDASYQKAVFDIFPDLMKTTALWATIGNHDVALSIRTGDTMPASTPYLDIFTFPTNAEAGGVSSGSEQYYSFNYANVHFVCLDSQVSARSTVKRNAMKSWLIDDLTANKADWTIVFFHHPPYSKGSHDSDSDGFAGIDTPILDMRKEFTPVFDEYGVDLVFSGHSHSYERSYYLGGHTGLSGSFNATTHAEVDGQGNLLSGQGAEAYWQITNAGIDNKVVYTVVGSSGKVSPAPLNHPAHALSLGVLASVVLDISANAIEAKALNVNGNVIDFYSLKRH